MLQTAQTQEHQAGNVLETIQGYEKGIIVTSMLLAAVIAGVLAWRTTQAIAQSTQTQLLHTEKMASLGQMMAGIAHEINNPLGFIGFIDGNVKAVRDHTDSLMAVIDRIQQEVPHATPALEEDLAELGFDFVQADLPQALQSMQRGTERIASIVLSLKRFARLQEEGIKPTDLHEGLDSTLVILGPRLQPQGNRSAIELVKDYGELPLVQCYGGDINQVFVNILGNAIDALNERWHSGRKSVSKDPHRTKERPQIHICTRCDTEQVAIEIANNGSAMSQFVQARVFDPFFTTKPVGKGTGMGLSISYDIVTQKHRGTLSCSSPINNTDHGARFTITLPRYLDP